MGEIPTFSFLHVLSPSCNHTPTICSSKIPQSAIKSISHSISSWTFLHFPPSHQILSNTVLLMPPYPRLGPYTSLFSLLIPEHLERRGAVYYICALQRWTHWWAQMRHVKRMLDLNPCHLFGKYCLRRKPWISKSNLISFMRNQELLSWLQGASLMAQWWRICLQCKRCGFSPWSGKIPWRRKWQPTPVFLPAKSHGLGSLVGYSPWGCKSGRT